MILYRIVWVLVAAILKAYWRVTCEGRENVPPGPFVLAPVHRSFLDFAIVSCVTRRRLCYMAKEEIWRYPFFNRFLYALGAFPIRRGAVDRESMRRCMDVIERGEPVVMFPEGTRRTGPVVDDLYEGPAYVAAKTGVPIVPVGIGGSERALRKGKALPRPVKIHVVVGNPIQPPAPAEGGRVPRRVLREVTEELRQEVQRVFDQAQARAGAGPDGPSGPDA